ncbi:MAG: trypsin-like serine protease [Hyphomicrobiales bacterium]|nr:trypsin-like serine protease [Hyphomicrobiales bacterium]
MRESRGEAGHSPALGKRRRALFAVLATSVAWLTPAHEAQAIIGGAPAERPIGQSLVMVLAEGGGACSGVIISPHTVLTAGHCLPKGHQIRVYAPSADTPGPPHLIVPLASAVHPGYAANGVGTRRRSIDLALIRLPEALPASYTASSLSLAAPPGAGETVILAGDGLSQEGVAASSGKPRSLSLPVIEPFGRGTILLWAAPGDGESKGACEGDSGGAMLKPQGGLVAIIAFAEGTGHARCGKLTQGVLLAPQRQFIDAKLAEWGESARWTDQ